MMTIRFAILLFVAVAASAAEIPDSIVGTWQFDLLRTVSEQVDRVARLHPDIINPDMAKAQKSALSKSTDMPETHILLTVSEDTITVEGTDSFLTTNSYTVIGGNSRLLVVESTDEDGYRSVLNIRLVDGGIAVETTDCRNNPEQCERDLQRTKEKLRERYQGRSAENSPTDVDPAGAVLSAEGSILEGTLAAPDRDEVTRLKWVYFKPAENG